MKCKSFLPLLIFVLLLVVPYAFGQKVELIFSHQKHIEDVEASCTDCHAAADTSTSPAHNLLPDMDTCYNCHDSDSECTLCHKDPDNAVVYPRITDYISKFPHATHIKNKVECATCHKGVATSSDIFAKHLPEMSTCVSCHSDVQEVDYCVSCHAANKDLKPIDHKVAWRQEHGIVSQTEKNDCKMCHTENQCLDCHQKDNLDRKVHPLNFRNNHSLYAKGNMDNCYTCHEELSYCVSCHRQEFVMPRNHASAGWSNPETGGAHARIAKMDLDTCLSCHNDPAGEPVCLQCHEAK